MTVVVHPALEDDIRRYAGEYGLIYETLGQRFFIEVRAALTSIETGPEYAGHLLKTRLTRIKDIRRCNLHSFPFFVLYGTNQDSLLIASLIPSRSDPLTWLTRFQNWPPSNH